MAFQLGKDEAMTGSTPDEKETDSEQFSMLEVATFVLRHRWLIVGFAGVLFLIAVTARVFADRQYTSSASFVPQASDKMAGLAGLAAQFGVTATGPDATESPAFYADLLKTREVLTTILQGEYRFPTDTGTVSVKLIDLLAVEPGPAELRMVKAGQALTARLKVDLKPRTGVVAFELPMPNPVLAQQVVQRFLDEVNRFNLERRNSKAGAERRFIEGRMAELQRELRDAETGFRRFCRGTVTIGTRRSSPSSTIA